MANPCTRCGKVHPKGKKKKANTTGFKCRDITTRKAQTAQISQGERIRFTPMEQRHRDAKHAVMKELHERIKQNNIKEMKEKQKNKPSPEVQLKRLDKRLGKGVGAEKERSRLKELIAK